jgi:Glycosyl transferase family 21
VIVFVDDDIVVAPGTVTQHLLRHEDGDRKVVSGASLVRLPEQRLAGDFPRYLYDTWYRHSMDLWAQDPDMVLRVFWGGHFSVRRADMLAIQGETSAYGDTYGEDSYLGSRFLRAGVRGEYAPEIKAEHLYERSVPAFRRDARGAGVMQAKLERLAPELLSTVGTYDARNNHPALTRTLVRLSEHRLLRPLVIAALLGAAAVGGRIRRFGIEDRAGTIVSAIENHAGYLEARWP